MLGLYSFQTGVRNGEFLLGVGKQNKGTILEVRSEDEVAYPPSRMGIDALSNTDITHKFRSIDFFLDMSPKDRSLWLVKNSTSNNDLYLSDTVKPIEVRIVKVGGAFMTENYSEISPDEWFTIKELEGMIPLKPGSRGLRGKSTLVFRGSNWEVLIEERKTDWEGLYIRLDAEAKIEHGKIKIDEEQRLIAFEDESSVAPNFAILYTPVRQVYTWEKLTTLIPGDLKEDFVLAKELLNRFTSSPAFFKSLLQKIIRFRATTCSFIVTEKEMEKYGKGDRRFKEDKTVILDARAALLAVISHLIMHPGAFVPNIQRFVTGMESAFKRVAVAICEDSWTKKKKDLLALYCGAALAQREKNFIPNEELVRTLFILAAEAQQEKYCFVWKLGEAYEYKEIDEWSACSMVLEHVKSFQTDIDMVRYIASTGGNKNLKYLLDGRLDNLFVYQAIDHHTNPEVAYFFAYERWNMSYPDLFGKIWDISSSFNPRKRRFVDSGELRDIQIAQKLCMMAKFYDEEKKEKGEKGGRSVRGSEKFSYTIDKSWLAGLIGPIQTGNANVVLRVDDLASFTAIKKPSRTDKNPELTEEEKENAIDGVKKFLESGVKLTKCPPCLSIFQNVKVRFDIEEEVYYLFMDGKWKQWEDCITLDMEVGYHRRIERNFYETITDAIQTTGEGIEEACFPRFGHLLSELEPFVLRRLATTITGMATKVTLDKIGRDGTGIDYTVYSYDTVVFQTLCQICNLFPAALEMDGTSFTIKNGTLFWKLRDLIGEEIAKLQEKSDVEWVIGEDRRKMWEHQIDIVNTMKERNKAGKKGHLIWMQMGSGKSMCVTQYIRYLIKEKKMPRYVVWCLPPSAIDSIEKEIDMAGIEHKLLDCRKNKDQELEEGKINIVRHDHLRLNGFDEVLKELASNVLFIIDEFHKTMNKTIRTSIALDIVKLSYDFVGLSGTIVKDNEVDQLIEWLQQICDFEVTKHNYWVAVGALISRKVVSKIFINREFIEIEASERYYKLVPPSLGGTSQVINFRAAVEESYRLVTEEMIKLAKKYLDEGTRVFIVAKDVKHQEVLASALRGYNLFKIDKDKQITLGPNDDDSEIGAVITTIRQCEGYTLSLIHVGITSVYFSNQATRDQLLGRLDRLNNPSDTIDWITVSSGILSYIHEKYEFTRSLAQALKSFAKDINLSADEIKYM